MGGYPPPPFDSYRISVEGLATILGALPDIKAYAHPDDIDEIIKANPGLSIDRFQPTLDGYTLQLPLHDNNNLSKKTTLKFIHTPGHTPGAQCILVNDCSLFAGDTIFVGSCGRVDFPESNPQLMWHSLSEKIKSLDEKVL